MWQAHNPPGSLDLAFRLSTIDYWLLAIGYSDELQASPGGASSEIERNSQLLKQLLVLPKILVSEFIEPAVLLKLFEEGIHL